MIPSEVMKFTWPPHCEEFGLSPMERVERKLHHIAESLARIEGKQDIAMGQAQDAVNAVLAQLQAEDTGIAASFDRISAEIATLKDNGVDTSALEAEMATHQAHVDTIANIVPLPADPGTGDGTPAPTDGGTPTT